MEIKAVLNHHLDGNMNFREWLLNEDVLQNYIKVAYYMYQTEPSQENIGNLLGLVSKFSKEWYDKKTQDDDENKHNEFASDITFALMKYIREKKPIDNILGWLDAVLHYTYRQQVQQQKMSRKKINILKQRNQPSEETEQLDYKEYINILKPEHQKIIELLSQGLKYKEIAEKLHRPLNTIKQWFRQIRILTTIARLHDADFSPQEILKKVQIIEPTKTIIDISKIIDMIKEKRYPQVTPHKLGEIGRAHV